MATWYIHPLLGSSANNGTSQSTPKQFYDTAFRALTAAGDTVLFAAGYYHPIIDAFIAPRSGTPAKWTYYGSYGSSQVRYAFLYNPAGTGNMILNCAGSKYITFEDLFFDMRGTDVRYSLNLCTQSASVCSDVVVRRCLAYGSNSASGNGDGFSIYKQASATGVVPYNILLEDCQSFGNGGHGVFVQGTGIVVRRHKALRNGSTAPYGAHGISFGAPKFDMAASGWNVSSGNVYQRNLPANHADVYGLRMDGYGSYISKYTGATPATSTPANQYAVAGGVLYLNLNGVNPNTLTGTYAWDQTQGNVVEFCEAAFNYWSRSAPYREGHGIAMDDWSKLSVIRGNYVHHNEGLGLSNNRGDGNRWVANDVAYNALAAFSANPADAVELTNNTFWMNNTDPGTYSAEANFNGDCSNGRINNNLIVCGAGDAYGVSIVTTNVGFSGASNLVYGAELPFQTGTFVDTDVSDPARWLDSDRTLLEYGVDGVRMLNPLAKRGAYVANVVTRNGIRGYAGAMPVGAYGQEVY